MDFTDHRARLVAALLAATAALLAYLATAGNGPYWQDSGLYLAALHQGGGLYPPGFPLWLLLARPFVWLLGLAGVPFTYATHVFSALWGALAAGLATLSMLLIATPGYRFFVRGETTEGAVKPEPLSRATLAVAAVMGTATGWSYSLWFQSITAEVYSMHAALCMGVLYCVLRLGAEGPLPVPGQLSSAQRRWIWAFACVSGFSFANHPSAVIWLPALAVLLGWQYRLWASNPGFVLKVLGVWFLCGFLPYLSLPMIAVWDPQTQYGDVTSLAGFLDHVSASKWTGQQSSFGVNGWRFLHFPWQCWQELLIAGLAALPFGVRRWWSLGPGAWGWGIAFLVPAFWIPILYLQGSEYDFWFIPLWLVGWVLSGAGALELFGWCRRPVWFAPALGALALVPPLFVNAPLLHRGGDHVPEDFGRQLLDTLEPNALYFAISDQECSLTFYAQRVRGVRPDVVVVQKPVSSSGWYPDWLRATYPDLQVPEPPAGRRWDEDEFAAHLVRANPDRVPYVSAKPLPLKLQEGEFWLPHAGLWRLHRGEGQALLDPKVWELRYRNDDPYGRPMRLHHQQKRYAGARWYPVRTTYLHEAESYHQQAWVNLAQFYRRQGAPQLALDAYKRLFALWPDLPHDGLRREAAAFAQERGDPWRPSAAPE